MTVDGLLATGKSTNSKKIVEILTHRGIPTIWVNSGTIYRGLAYLATQLMDGWDLSLEEVLGNGAQVLLGEAPVNGFEFRDGLIWLCNSPVPDEELRKNHISTMVPAVAAVEAVRAFVAPIQKAAAENFDGIVLVDGRDGGTSIHPDAALKLFLTVDDKTAAKRLGITVEEVRARNLADSSRLTAPMVPADDAIIIDTTPMLESEVTDVILALLLPFIP